MKIVVTDGYTLNPGDLSWDALTEFGEIVYYDRTNPEEVISRCRLADVLVTNKTPITEETINSALQLKVIAVTATGYNIVDIAAAQKRGVVVCNVPEYGTHSVAQHTFALILELTNRVGLHAESVARGEWVNSPDFSFAKSPIIELKDKVLGIIGLGRIGRQTLEIAQAFGMRVIHHGGKDPAQRASHVTLKELFSQSDFISLHCPLKPDNKEFVNKALLGVVKPTAFLINTSRGQLIKEDDLAEALNNSKLAGAALDVLSKEPPDPQNPLLKARNCIITPHNAWVSIEARQRIMKTTIDNIRQALKGQAQNKVT